MNKTHWKFGVIGAAVLALAGGGVWWYTQKQAASEVQYRTSKIERGSLQASVSASGQVNPVTQVSVSTQVSGQIKELYVDFNSEVKAGQLIALIDPETFEYRVRSAQADVDSARALVLTAQANVASSRAQVSRARMDLAEAQRDAERQQMLVDKQFVAQSVSDKAKALVSASSESVKVAEAQMAVTAAQVKSAEATVAQRESSLAQARIDLTRTKITSPVNGIVIKRSIEKGQTVAASLSSPELFVIAQNLQDMQVDASIDESDVGRIRTGQKATFTVDAFAGQTFDGEVRQVRKAAQNVANVVTYVAVIGFSNNGGRLLPGMTANVRVVTEARENVLKVANAALRMKIAGVEPAAAATPASGSGPAGAAGAAKPPAASTGDASGWTWLSQAVAQQQGAGGGQAAQRERLVTELQLTAEQQTRLDAISAEMRPTFMAMRELSEDERPAARDKATSDMRLKIKAMLTPEQKVKYQQMVQAQMLARQGVAASGDASKSIAPQAGSTPAKAQKQGEKEDSKPAATAPAAVTAAATVAASPAISVKPAAPAPVASSAAPDTAAAAVAAGGGNNPATQFRNRLVAELALSAAQIEKVDGIYTDARPKFMALRDLPQEERGKARERITADIRAKLREMMTPEQKPRFDAIVMEAASRQSTRGRIYLMGADGKPKAYNVRLGISDGSSTELIVTPNFPNAPNSSDSAELVEGAAVIIGTVNTGNSSPAAGGQRPAGAAGPRMAF
ncbi:MAG: efflux RND transporter periplasmic adaptor subunit [Burkholderiaceae bacterium]|nr:efflux RND transporter periplasmic adaptor subunit [Burkholderiaceae bacterium]